MLKFVFPFFFKQYVHVPRALASNFNLVLDTNLLTIDYNIIHHLTSITYNIPDSKLLPCNLTILQRSSLTIILPNGCRHWLKAHLSDLPYSLLEHISGRSGNKVQWKNGAFDVCYCVQLHGGVSEAIES